MLVNKKVRASRVLGVDSSSNSIAWCLFFNRKPAAMGEIMLEGSSFSERLAKARGAFEVVLDKTKPDFIAIETVVFVNNKDVVIKLAKIVGVLEAETGFRNISCTSVTPKTWQYYIGNNSWTNKQKLELRKQFPRKSNAWYNSRIREARKRYTIEFFNKRYGLDIESDNIADAAGIAYYCYNELTKRR